MPWCTVPCCTACMTILRNGCSAATQRATDSAHLPPMSAISRQTCTGVPERPDGGARGADRPHAVGRRSAPGRPGRDGQRLPVLGKNGCPWRSLPSDVGPWATVCTWHDRFRADGIRSEAAAVLTRPAPESSTASDTWRSAGTAFPWVRSCVARYFCPKGSKRKIGRAIDVRHWSDRPQSGESAILDRCGSAIRPVRF